VNGQPRKMSGFTLVELMVTLVISMAILAALSQAFVSGNTAYSVQDRLGELQENGRYALYFMQRDIRMAGYPGVDPTVVPFAISPSSTVCTSLSLPANFTCDGTGNAANNGSDQIAVQYRVDVTGGMNNCLGASIASGLILTNTYAISKDPTTGLSRLTCNGQPIVEGIEAMQILYGVDTDVNPTAAGFGVADYYVPANSTRFSGNPTLWQQKVVSVRIALLATTITPVFGDKPTDSTPSFTLLDGTPIGPLASGIRGKVFTATIQLRNRGT
jgi:type IV pilus assembly protein PilW